jgi:ubiquinone/menaquinone biosynthesis C-methylase UbiE
VSVARWRDVWRRFSGSGAYPHELAFLLLVPLRRYVMSPAQLLERLQLTPTFRVLEIGSGPGYFSVAVARAVPRGSLQLLDLQREMLEKARARLRRAGVTNVGFTQASAALLPFRAQTFDAVFLVAVLGEVPDPRACMQSVARVLRPGGLAAIAELPGDADVLAASQLLDFAAGTGLSIEQSGRAGRASFTSFRKASPPAGAVV